MKTNLDHVNFTVNNLKESSQFYQNLFDFEVVESGKNDWGAFHIMKNGQSMLALREDKGSKNSDQQKDFDFHRIQHFALNVDSKTEWEKRLDHFKPEMSIVTPILYPFSTSWYVYDPNGHEIEVVHWNEKKPKFPEST